MCPSYLATNEEKHSTRGRARLAVRNGARRCFDRGILQWRGRRRARPLPGVQGLQERLPGAGRYGELQGRISRAALRRAAASQGRLCNGANSPLGARRCAGARIGKCADAGAGLVVRCEVDGWCCAGPDVSALRVAGFSHMVFAPRKSAPRRRTRDALARHIQQFLPRENGHRRNAGAGETGLRSGDSGRVLCCGRPLYDWGWLEQARGLWRKTWLRWRRKSTAVRRSSDWSRHASRRSGTNCRPCSLATPRRSGFQKAPCCCRISLSAAALTPD